MPFSFKPFPVATFGEYKSPDADKNTDISNMCGKAKPRL